LLKNVVHVGWEKRFCSPLLIHLLEGLPLKAQIALAEELPVHLGQYAGFVGVPQLPDFEIADYAFRI